MVENYHRVFGVWSGLPSATGIEHVCFLTGARRCLLFLQKIFCEFTPRGEAEGNWAWTMMIHANKTNKHETGAQGWGSKTRKYKSW